MRIIDLYRLRKQRKAALSELADIYLQEKWVAQMNQAQTFNYGVGLPPAQPVQPALNSAATAPPVTPEDPIAASVTQLVNDLEAEERAMASTQPNTGERSARLDAIKRRAY